MFLHLGLFSVADLRIHRVKVPWIIESLGLSVLSLVSGVIGSAPGIIIAQ